MAASSIGSVVQFGVLAENALVDNLLAGRSYSRQALVQLRDDRPDFRGHALELAKLGHHHFMRAELHLAMMAEGLHRSRVVTDGESKAPQRRIGTVLMRSKERYTTLFYLIRDCFTIQIPNRPSETIVDGNANRNIICNGLQDLLRLWHQRDEGIAGAARYGLERDDYIRLAIAKFDQWVAQNLAHVAQNIYFQMQAYAYDARQLEFFSDEYSKLRDFSARTGIALDTSEVDAFLARSHPHAEDGYTPTRRGPFSFQPHQGGTDVCDPKNDVRVSFVQTGNTLTSVRIHIKNGDVLPTVVVNGQQLVFAQEDSSADRTTYRLNMSIADFSNLLNGAGTQPTPVIITTNLGHFDFDLTAQRRW